MDNSRKIVIGLITYGKSTARYLPYFLPSLFSQSYNNYQVIVIDNSEEENNENISHIKAFPQIEYKWAGENLGFAKGYNLMIKRASEIGAEFFLALNPDMILEPNVLDKLVEAMMTDKNIAAVQPKILKWDFENNRKTDLIDSYGLVVDRKHRFFDRYQGKKDGEHLAEPKDIFGFTGAAVLLRMSALEEVAYKDKEKKEYFDELMFMYKEDCDLSYRLRLAGFKVIFEPNAVAYHDRTATAVGEGFLETLKNRRNKSRKVKEWSFLNQWIILLKYKNVMPSQIQKETFSYYVKASLFILFLEPYLLRQIWKLWMLKKEINKRREALIIKKDLEFST